MLSKKAIKRVEEKWNPPQWPLGAASEYAKVMHKRPFSYFRERIAHLGISGKFAVDAGCGTGTWSFALACAFDRVLGIDYTHDRLELANELRSKFKLSQPEFLEGDIRKIPVEDGTVDAVFCYSVALGSVSIEQLFAEFYRVLRPGGVLYVELNGIGYGYILFDKNPSAKKIGADVVYNTYGQTVLLPVIAQIGPGMPANEIILSAKPGATPLHLLDEIGASSDALAAAKKIVEVLGSEYEDLLAADLRALATGERKSFSKPTTGRGYLPEDLQAASSKSGFKRFEWAPEGMLSIKNDGTVQAEKSPAAPPISAPEYNGHLLRFETASWK